MQKIYRIIKKKRNLRRLSGVWLFLVVIELFCPVFCDVQVFGSENNFPETAIIHNSEACRHESNNSVSVSDKQNSDTQHKNICNDECLCHSVAITSINTIVIKHSVSAEEKIIFKYGEPLFNTLSPPFHPPKLS